MQQSSDIGYTPRSRHCRRAVNVIVTIIIIMQIIITVISIIATTVIDIVVLISNSTWQLFVALLLAPYFERKLTGIHALLTFTNVTLTASISERLQTSRSRPRLKMTDEHAKHRTDSEDRQ